MKERDLINLVKGRAQIKLPGWISGLFWILVILGLVSFIGTLARGGSTRAWQSFLVNFLFWSGISQAGIVFSAILQVTNARWGRALKRIAEAMAAFLPVSFILFIVFFWGRETLFPWINEPIPAKQAWLNVPFLFIRNMVGLFLLHGLSLVFVYYSLRPDIGMVAGKNPGRSTGFAGIFINHWKGLEIEQKRSQQALDILSPIILILYSFVYTVLAFDLIMSLDPEWFSTLFGAYFFVGNFYLGLVAIAVLVILMRRHLQLEAFINSSHFHDLGKLIFAFCMLTGDFFWSQFLILWYGNLPEEIGYIIVRIKQMPWAYLSWLVLLGSYIVPFIILLSRNIKRNPQSLLTVSTGIIISMWLERYILVVPSIWHENFLPLGLTEVLISLGYFGGFSLAFLAFIRKIPCLPIADPLFQEKLQEEQIS